MKLYCTFVDFEKAFGKVATRLLWHKLLVYNINDKLEVFQIYQGKNDLNTLSTPLFKY